MKTVTKDPIAEDILPENRAADNTLSNNALPNNALIEKQLMESTNSKTRLLIVAGKMFAEKGVAATSVRELARQAGVNIAAINYHFGSKENLYLETLRHNFKESQQMEQDFRPLVLAAQKDGSSEAAKEAIKKYIEIFIHTLFSSEQMNRHAALMAREMSDPSPALDVIVEEFIRPKHSALINLIQQAAPHLIENKELPFFAFSIVAQCLHYRLTLPINLKLLGCKEMTSDLIEKVAKHIAEFSLRALKD